jgi:hypothetical protein
MRTMPAQPDDAVGWRAPLADRLGTSADASQAAHAISVLWHEIDQALHPVIGRRGVAALFSRSLALSAVTHPWLALGHLGAPVALDTTALNASALQQSAADAVAGGNAMFQSFQALLASLVGAALTDRLLSPVWARTMGAASGQDPSHE